MKIQITNAYQPHRFAFKFIHKIIFYGCYGLLFLANPVLANDVKIIPITLQEGEGHNSDEVFSRNSEQAEKAGVDLSAELDKLSAQGYIDDNAFVLFYNFVQATGCERDYVVQTVKLAKKFYDSKGKVNHEKNEYLVEVMKLNESKITKKPDQHLKRYALGNAHSRNLVATYQVGCGKIPNIIDGNAWPFKPSKSYRRLQNYSESPNLYNQVKFDFFKQYTLEINFDADGNIAVELPYFLTPTIGKTKNSN